jgi:hypothetical protein
MAYCNTTQVKLTLTQSLTSASTATTSAGLVQPGQLMNVGRQLNLNVIPQADVDYYIQLADGHINAALSQQYVTPLPEKADVEMTLLMDMDEYGTEVRLDRALILSPGDVLVFTDGTNMDRVTVDSILDNEVVTTVEPIINLYPEGTRVMRVKFPDPIPYIAAKLAAAAIFKKYFSAQVEPGKSEYGETVRMEAIQELNNIREGRTILHGVRRIGWRFANPELIERYNMKGSWDQDATRSDQTR